MRVHASLKEILARKTTDIYFKRAEEILKKTKRNPEIVAEIWTKNLPDDYKWGIFTGLEEALKLFKGLKVNVWSLPEGSLFYPEEPVLTIKGKYLKFATLETPLLGFLCQASGISTKAARCKITAGDRTVLSFGARRMHPSLTPIIDRYAYMGGFDGVSALLSGEKLGIEPMGTIPHSIILIFGNTISAALAYDETFKKDVPRIILVDTFLDEKVEAMKLAESFGEKLDAIRIDTPKSRRGDFALIAKEIREELDNNGYDNIKIFASGGLDERDIIGLNPWVNGYGIGTSLSNAQTINFSMDIVEIDGKPLAKKGKTGGMKFIYQCMRCGKRRIIKSGGKIKRCTCENEMKMITEKYIDNGKIVMDFDSVSKIRKSVLDQVRYINV